MWPFKKKEEFKILTAEEALELAKNYSDKIIKLCDEDLKHIYTTIDKFS